MSGFQVVREISWARAGSSRHRSSASVEVTVESGTGQGMDVRFTAPRQRPDGLERAAIECWAETSERLPEPLRDRLAVEAGEVRSFLRRDGEPAPLFARDYRIASCRGVVLGVDGGLFEPPWTGILAAEELDPTFPVVLAPSAVLALLSYALEVTGSHVETRRDAEIPGITVVDTASSPYPPQHHPFEGDGSASSDRPLIAEGRWSNREEHAGDDVDPLFLLLTRPERALRPLMAATHFNRRNLAVRCSRTALHPAEAVLVDSWRVRVGPRGGAVPFHAELSRTGPGGTRLAVTTAVALHFDPWEVLARVLGVCGPSAPAVDEDPIEGDSYGEAPTLATGLRLADLAAPRKAG